MLPFASCKSFNNVLLKIEKGGAMMNNLWITVAISLIAGAAGGGIYLFVRAKLRARRRRKSGEEIERMVDYSEFPHLSGRDDSLK